jgi:hypothetical protein
MTAHSGFYISVGFEPVATDDCYQLRLDSAGTE